MADVVFKYLTVEELESQIDALPEKRLQVEAREALYITLAHEQTVRGLQYYCLFVHGWVLEPHHLEWAAKLIAGERVCIVAPPEPLALDTPVRTVGGWKTIQTIEAGDFVFNEQGKPVPVIGKSPVFEGRDVYEVLFSDGSRIEADANHRWVTWVYNQRKRRREPRETTTRQIRDTLLTCYTGRSGQPRHAIPLTPALVLPEAQLPLDPYLLGLWLGDGDSSGYEYTTVDDETTAAFETAGFATKRKGIRVYVSGITPKLREVGVLNNKHIPADYLNGSAAQRLALLQGLIDSDGRIGVDGNCRFTNTNQSLSEGVLALALSLGCKATLQEHAGTTKPGLAVARGRTTKGQTEYRVHFTPLLPVSRIPRKADRIKSQYQKRASYRYIVAVNKIPSKPVQCITVDSESHLFLAGKTLISTGNTGKSRLLRAWCEWAIGHRRDRAIMIIANTITQAKKSVWGVGQVIAHSRNYRKVFPECVPTEHWARHEIYVDRSGLPMEFRTEPTLAGFGIDGAYQGTHVDDLIIDDPTDQADVNSPPKMLLQREQVTGVLYDRLKEGGNLFGILTRWADDDLVPTLEQIGVSIEVYPAYRDKAEPYQWDAGSWTQEHPVSLLSAPWANHTRLMKMRQDKGHDFFNLTFLCQVEGAVRGERVFPLLNYERHYVSMQAEGRQFIKVIAKRAGVDWGPLPEDTELLTRRGFKHRTELALGEEVAAYDWSGTNTVVWSPLLAIVTNSRPLVRMKNKSFDFRCSPEHAWIVQRPERGRMVRNTVRRQALQDIRGVHHARLVLAASTDESSSTLTPAEAAVLGWLVTDGHIGLKSAQVYQKSFCADLLRDLQESGLAWNEQKERPDGIRTFHLAQPSTRLLLRKAGYSTKDDLPSVVTQLSTEAQQRMLHAMMLAEGTANGTSRKRVFTQNAGPVLEAFQILSALTGQRLGALYPHKSQYGAKAWRQGYVNSPYTRLDTLTYEDLPEEPVWCPTVKEGAVIVRQGGQITITGNTTQAHQSAMVVVTKNKKQQIWVRAAWMSPRGSTVEMGEKAAAWQGQFGVRQIHYDRSQGSLKDMFEQIGYSAFKGEHSVDLRIGALRTLLEEGLFFVDMEGEGTQKLWSQITNYRYDEVGRVVEIMDDLVDALLYAVYAILEASKSGVGPMHEIVAPRHRSNDGDFDPDNPWEDSFDPTQAASVTAPDVSKRRSMSGYGI